jgi:hypothetical protein
MTSTEQPSYRASSLARIEACPASIELSKIAPPDTGSAIAERGDRIHAAIAAHMTGAEIPALEEGEDDVVQIILARINRMYEAKPDEVLVEQKMELQGPGFLLTGTVDLVMIFGDHAVVMDHKTGFTPVAPAGENIQLLAYTLMLASKRRDLKRFDIVINQPMLTGGGTGAMIEIKDLRDVWQRLDRLAKSVTPDAAPTPSESACQYCPALSICPAHKANLATVSKLDVVHSWGSLTVADKTALWKQLRMAKAVIGKYETLFREELEANPDAFPGEIRLTAGKTMTKITKPAGLFIALQAVGLTGNQFSECVEVKKTELEKVVKALTGRKGREWDGWWNFTLAPFVETSTTKGSLETVK